MNQSRAAASRLLPVWRRVVQVLARPVIRRATREALQGRPVDPEDATRGRWLRSDVRALRKETWGRVGEILPDAHLAQLPTWGSRLNVFMAAVTTAAYQEMLARGLPRDYAAALVADVGWKVYAWMLTAAAIPARLLPRSRKQRLDRTLELLMWFPFSAPGKPAYEVRAWSDGERFFTHWSHCPPHTFVRSLVESGSDRGELDAFYRSWCLYDWAGADLLVGDGHRGHYDRPHTLSRGDAACDMCWYVRPADERRPDALKTEPEAHASAVFGQAKEDRT